MRFPPLVHHAVSVIHIDPVQWVFRIRMLGVIQERAIAQLAPKHAMLVKGTSVESIEIVLREYLAAARALQLPRRSPAVVHPRAPSVWDDPVRTAGAAWHLPFVEYASIGDEGAG